MPISAPRRSTRRSLVVGLLKGFGAMSLAPAILTREADASTQLAQGRSGVAARDSKHRFEEVGSWPLDQPAIQARFSPDGSRVAIRLTRDLDIYDLPSGRRVVRIPFPTDVSDATFGFGPDGLTLLVGPRRGSQGSDEIAQVFEIDGSREPHSIRMPRVDREAGRRPKFIATSLNGKWGAIATMVHSRRNAIFIIEMNSKIITKIIYQENDSNFFEGPISISNDGMIATCQYNRQRFWEPTRLCIFNARSGLLERVLEGNRPGVASMVWAADGLTLATGGLQPSLSPALQDDKERASIRWGEKTGLWLWTARDWRRISEFEIPAFPVDSVAISSSAAWVAAIHGRDDRRLGGEVSIWDTNTKSKLYSRKASSPDFAKNIHVCPSDRFVGWVEGSSFRLLAVQE